MGIKNYVFSFWFQKCKFDLGKSATKKSFSQKSVYWKIGFLGKTFLGCTLLRSNVNFWNQCKRRIFSFHFTYWKKKNYHLIKESMCTFYDLKSHGFSSPFQKFYARHMGIKSLVPTLQLLYSTYGTACKLLFLFSACLLSFLWLLTASFFFGLPLA